MVINTIKTTKSGKTVEYGVVVLTLTLWLLELLSSPSGWPTATGHLREMDCR